MHQTPETPDVEHDLRAPSLKTVVDYNLLHLEINALFSFVIFNGIPIELITKHLIQLHLTILLFYCEDKLKVFLKVSCFFFYKFGPRSFRVLHPLEKVLAQNKT